MLGAFVLDAGAGEGYSATALAAKAMKKGSQGSQLQQREHENQEQHRRQSQQASSNSEFDERRLTAVTTSFDNVSLHATAGPYARPTRDTIRRPYPTVGLGGIGELSSPSSRHGSRSGSPANAPRRRRVPAPIDRDERQQREDEIMARTMQLRDELFHDSIFQHGQLGSSNQPTEMYGYASHGDSRDIVQHVGAAYKPEIPIDPKLLAADNPQLPSISDTRHPTNITNTTGASTMEPLPSGMEDSFRWNDDELSFSASRAPSSRRPKKWKKPRVPEEEKQARADAVRSQKEVERDLFGKPLPGPSRGTREEQAARKAGRDEENRLRKEGRNVMRRAKAASKEAERAARSADTIRKKEEKALQEEAARRNSALMANQKATHRGVLMPLDTKGGKAMTRVTERQKRPSRGSDNSQGREQPPTASDRSLTTTWSSRQTRGKEHEHEKEDSDEHHDKRHQTGHGSGRRGGLGQ